MMDHILDFEHRARNKVLCTAGGVVIGAGTLLLAQGCPGGQCAACGGNCATKLPLLTIPLVLQGAALMIGKIRQAADRGT